MDDLNSRQEINKYRKFKKVDGATYRKVNQFLRRRTYITAREWALARLCTDFRTSGGAEMTFIGKHLPELVPFMEDTYTPQAVNQARNAFKKKVRKSSATFFYGAMCGFFTTDELDDLLFEASEVARFLLEVEGTTLDIDEEIDIEDRITKVMRGVGQAANTLLKSRGDEGSQKEPLEIADQPSVASDQGDPPPGFTGAPVKAGTSTSQISPAITNPAGHESLTPKTSGPTTEMMMSAGPPVSDEHPRSPDDSKIYKKDEPAPAGKDKIMRTLKTDHVNTA
jgi:hypothetical protein